MRFRLSSAQRIRCAAVRRALIAVDGRDATQRHGRPIRTRPGRPKEGRDVGSRLSAGNGVSYRLKRFGRVASSSMASGAVPTRGSGRGQGNRSLADRCSLFLILASSRGRSMPLWTAAASVNGHTGQPGPGNPDRLTARLRSCAVQTLIAERPRHAKGQRWLSWGPHHWARRARASAFAQRLADGPQASAGRLGQALAPQANIRQDESHRTAQRPA